MATAARSTPRTRDRRNGALDGLRAIAALTVFGFHAWLYTLPVVSAAAARDASVGDRIAAELRIGLVLFFVLSGFLLYRAWVAAALDDGRSAPRLGTYTAHRVGRIVPAYWVAIAGSVALLWPLAGEPGVRLPPVAQLPLFLVFGQNLSPDTIMKLDAPMWTLAVEAAFYAVLPLLGWFALRGPRTRRAQVLVPLVTLGVGVAFNVAIAHGASSVLLGKSLPAMLPYFALGMLAAVLVHGRRPSPRWAAALLSAGVVLVIADGVLHAVAESGTTLAFLLRCIRDLPAAMGFAAIVAVAATAPPRALAVRPLAWVGEVSYGLYLWHVPVILWLRGHGLMPVSMWGAMLVALPVALVAAWLSWRLVERPSIAWSRRTHRLGANPAVSPPPGRSAAAAPGRTRSTPADAPPSPPGSPPRPAGAPAPR